MKTQIKKGLTGMAILIIIAAVQYIISVCK